MLETKSVVDSFRGFPEKHGIFFTLQKSKISEEFLLVKTLTILTS